MLEQERSRRRKVKEQKWRQEAERRFQKGIKIELENIDLDPSDINWQ